MLTLTAQSFWNVYADGVKIFCMRLHHCEFLLLANFLCVNTECLCVYMHKQVFECPIIYLCNCVRLFKCLIFFNLDCFIKGGCLNKRPLVSSQLFCRLHCIYFVLFSGSLLFVFCVAFVLFMIKINKISVWCVFLGV